MCIRDRNYPHLIIEDGKATLNGRLPAQEVVDLYMNQTVQALGEGNVVNNYVVDPTIPLYPATPLIVDGTVTFDFNSTEVRDEFVPMVADSVAVLNAFEGSSIVIAAYADAQGPEDVNLAISKQRADNVVDLHVAAGIDPSRIVGMGKGEIPESMLDDSGVVAAQHRRAEFLLTIPLAGG